MAGWLHDLKFAKEPSFNSNTRKLKKKTKSVLDRCSQLRRQRNNSIWGQTGPVVAMEDARICYFLRGLPQVLTFFFLLFPFWYLVWFGHTTFAFCLIQFNAVACCCCSNYYYRSSACLSLFALFSFRSLVVEKSCIIFISLKMIEFNHGPWTNHHSLV